MPANDGDKNGNSSKLSSSLHPTKPSPGFVPTDIRIGEGPSGQRHIFGRTFSDKSMCYSDFELERVNQLTQHAFDLDPLLESNGIDETQKLRFLQGCDWKLDIAADSLREHIEWRKGLPDPTTKPTLKGNTTSFVYWHGSDKFLRPILIINCKKLNEIRQARNSSNDLVRQEILNCMTYFINHLVHPGLVEQILVIVDLKDCSAWDAPIDFVQQTAKILTANFRARLHKVFIINTPLLFYAFWRVAKCFIPDRTVAKCQIHRYDYMNALLEQIPADQLDPGLVPEERESVSSSSSSTW